MSLSQKLSQSTGARRRRTPGAEATGVGAEAASPEAEAASTEAPRLANCIAVHIVVDCAGSQAEEGQESSRGVQRGEGSQEGQGFLKQHPRFQKLDLVGKKIKEGVDMQTWPEADFGMPGPKMSPPTCCS